MRSHLIPRIMNGLHTITLMALIGLLSWGLAQAILGTRITIIMITIATLAVVLRVHRGRSFFKRHLRGQKISRKDYAPLHDMVADLSRRAHLRRAPDLWYTPGKVPNAHAVGTRRHGAIAFSEGLISSLTLDEFTGVIAHEIAHISHGDLWIMHMASAMGRAFSRILRFGTALLVLATPLILAGYIPIPWVILAVIFGYQATITALVRSLSRVREFEADRAAAQITGNPDALISALTRLHQMSPDRIVDKIWPVSLFTSHPLLTDRIARLERLRMP